MLHPRPRLKHIGARRASDSASCRLYARVCMYAHGWTGCTDAGTDGLLQVNSLARDWQPQICLQVNPTLRAQRGMSWPISFSCKLYWLPFVPAECCQLLDPPRLILFAESHMQRRSFHAVLRCRSLAARQGGILRCPWKAAGTISRWCVYTAGSGSPRDAARSQVESSLRN